MICTQPDASADVHPLRPMENKSVVRSHELAGPTPTQQRKLEKDLSKNALSRRQPGRLMDWQH